MERAVKVVTRQSISSSKSKQKVRPAGQLCRLAPFLLCFRGAQQLYAEIQIHKAVSQGGNHHPNVLNFLEWFEDRDNIYMVLELCTRGVSPCTVCMSVDHRGQFACHSRLPTNRHAYHMVLPRGRRSWIWFASGSA